MGSRAPDDSAAQASGKGPGDTASAEAKVEAGADAGAGSGAAGDDTLNWAERRRQRKAGKSHKNYGSVGVSSTDHLFSFEDKGELKRYLRLSRIVSKVATHISQAQGPQEILEWLWVSCKQFWSEHGELTVKVCLRDTFAPESVAMPSFLEPDSQRSVYQSHSACTGHEEELCCLDLRASAYLWAADPTADKHGERCEWYGASARMLVSEWEWLDLNQYTALRLSFQMADIVHDTLRPNGCWSFGEHAEMGDLKSVLYMPLSVRDERLGVLCVGSNVAQEFEPAERDTFAAVTEVAAVHLKALHMQYDMDHRRRTLERDRARHRELAAAYRNLLNDMLPSHVVDELSGSRTDFTAFSPRYADNAGDIWETDRVGTGGPLGASDHEPSSASQTPRTPQERSRPRSNSFQGGRLVRNCRRTNTLSLPSHITGRLNKLTYAEYHECVAILFSDVKGFTVLSERSDPAEIMVMLDDLFGRFDGIVERHAPAAYKVETIGDAYMIAFGLFGETGFCEETPTDYAVALRAIVVGAEMIKASRQVLTPSRDGPGGPVEVRLGIQLGRIMSGIIGKKVPRYCMFGDTVNTASRMESTGVPGKIHVTELVQNACKQGTPGRDLAFDSTGGLEVKGKGYMQTFLLDPEQVLSLNLCSEPQLELPFRRSSRSSSSINRDENRRPSAASSTGAGSKQRPLLELEEGEACGSFAIRRLAAAVVAFCTPISRGRGQPRA